MESGPYHDYSIRFVVVSVQTAKCQKQSLNIFFLEGCHCAKVVIPLIIVRLKKAVGRKVILLLEMGSSCSSENRPSVCAPSVCPLTERASTESTPAAQRANNNTTECAPATVAGTDAISSQPQVTTEAPVQQRDIQNGRNEGGQTSGNLNVPARDSFVAERRIFMGSTEITQDQLQLMKMLKHPNILKLLEVIDEPDAPDIKVVTQRIEHPRPVVEFTKEDKSECTPIVEGVAKCHMRGMYSAVSYMHQLKIVHRDITLEIFILDDDGRCNLTSFLAATHCKDGRLMVSDNHKGTYEYFNPEMLDDNQPEYSGELHDLWGLGVAHFEMLCGFLPFAGACAERKALVSSRPLGFPASLQVSDEAKSFISKVLDPDPTKRFATAEDALNDPYLAVDENETDTIEQNGYEKMKNLEGGNSAKVTLAKKGGQEVVIKAPKMKKKEYFAACLQHTSI